MKWYLTVVSVCIILTNNFGHVFMCLLAICVSSLEQYLCKFFFSFLKFGLFDILLLSCQCSLHILNTRLYQIYDLQTFPFILKVVLCLSFFFLISHQFYTHHFIHVNPNHPIQHTTIPTPLQFSPLGVHTFVLYISVSTSALQPGSSVPFF